MAASPPPEPPPSPSAAPPGAGDWLAGLRPPAAAADLGPLQLAWLGDGVWELHQRLRHCRLPARPQDLHRAVVGRVRAAAQAQALLRLTPLLRESELEWVRRGRNRAGRGPRGGDPALYGQATGFETMLGWLFLHDPPRLAVLLDQLEAAEPGGTGD